MVFFIEFSQAESVVDRVAAIIKACFDCADVWARLLGSPHFIHRVFNLSAHLVSRSRAGSNGAAVSNLLALERQPLPLDGCSRRIAAHFRPDWRQGLPVSISAAPAAVEFRSQFRDR